jgi:serine/threonine-protein kinase RsbW
MEEALRIELPARAESVAAIRNEVARRASDFGLELERLNALKVVVSEACGNVVRYAYDENEDGVIEVILFRREDELEVSVKDQGRGICPRSASVLPGLGMGLLLIGAMSSHFSMESRLGIGTELRIAVPI